MNPNTAFVRLASAASPIWFGLSVWVRYPIVVILSAFLGWLCFGCVGVNIKTYLPKVTCGVIFSTIGFVTFLLYFYQANVIMKYQLALNEKTFRDALTGLYNRRYLRIKRKHMKKLMVEGQFYLAAYFVDLNNFGLFNKQYQHRTGDLVLKVVARVIAATFRRQSDIVSRYGGDEFLIICLFERPEDCEEQGQLLKTKLENISLIINSKTEPISISGSVGWACDNCCNDDVIKRVVDLAEEDMKKQKQSMKVKPAQ